MSAWTDRNTLPGRNFILEHTGTALGYSLKDVVKVEASGAEVHAEMRVSADVAGGSQLTFATRPKDGAIADRLVLDHRGTLTLKNSAGGLFIGDLCPGNGRPQGIQLGGAGSGSNTRADFWGAGAEDDTRLAFFNANGQVGSIVTAGMATSYSTVSDHRLKTDVKPLAGALEVVKGLKPVQFAWAASGRRAEGFIAHELQERVPGAVTGAKDGQAMQQIDKSYLIPFLVQAIQELESRLRALEKNQ